METKKFDFLFSPLYFCVKAPNHTSYVECETIEFSYSIEKVAIETNNPDYNNNNWNLSVRFGDINFNCDMKILNLYSHNVILKNDPETRCNLFFNSLLDDWVSRRICYVEAIVDDNFISFNTYERTKKKLQKSVDMVIVDNLKIEYIDLTRFLEMIKKQELESKLKNS